MRTRRSWRNQDRLFAALFKPPEAPRPAGAPDTVAALERELAAPLLGRRMRADLEKRLAKARAVESVRAALASESAQ